MRLRLKSFESVEKRGNNIDTKINRFSIHDFNLIIGDNAQGKSRLFRTLNFLTQLFKEKPGIIETDYFGKLIFEIQNSKGIEEVVYEITIIPGNGENDYRETVIRNGKTIYSSAKKLLFNETAKKEVKNYFIPRNLPALSSINDPDFITINLLRNFFQRIVHVDSNKSRDITVSPKSMAPNGIGTDISSILKNWEDAYPDAFNEVMNEFKQCFPFIKKVDFTQKDFQGIMKADLLTFDEEAVEGSILQTQWSDGIYRLLHLLMTPKIPFTINGERMPPSLILVDEIENGLDFKRLKYIINYFQDYSDDSQIMISSHSPLVCDFAHPRDWIVVKRKGSELHFMSPDLREKDLDNQLDLFKHRHWDFYTRHISNSKSYEG